MKKYVKQWGSTVSVTELGNGDTVWSVEITPAMRDSVLYEGQTLFSDRDTETYDLLGQNKRLEEQNKALNQMVADLRARLDLERKVTGGKTLNANQIDAVARYIKNYANSDIDTKLLSAQIREVYQYIVEAEELDSNDVFAKLYEVARAVASKQKGTKVSDPSQSIIAKELRAHKIKLNAEQIAEIENVYGKNYKSALRGLVYFSNDGIDIESRWAELSEAYPSVFDADTNVADMATAIADIATSAREASNAIEYYNESEMVKELAVELMNKYWTVNPIRTTADRYSKEIAALKRKNADNVQKYREQSKKQRENMQNQRLADKMYYGKAIAKLKRERDEARRGAKQQIKEHDQRRLQRDLVKSITKESMTLNKWMRENGKDHHVPKEMRNVVSALLGAIDFSSNRYLEGGQPTKTDIRLTSALEDVRDMVSGNTEYDVPQFTFFDTFKDDVALLVKEVNEIAKDLGKDNEYVLNYMNVEQLQSLLDIVKTVKTAVTKINKFHDAEIGASVAQTAHEFADEMAAMPDYSGRKATEHTKKFLQWDNLNPVYAFDRFGDVGKKIFRNLQNGWGEFAYKSKQIIDFAGETFNAKQAKKHNETVRSFEVLLPATEEQKSSPDYRPKYQTLKLTDAQLMSLYCLSKREQGRKHILQGGIIPSQIDENGKTINQTNGVRLTETELQKMIDVVESNPELKTIADALQKYMNDECAKWGNEVTMARWGIEAYGEENYFPIKSNPNVTGTGEVKDENESSLFRLLNLSFTKKLNDNANNEIEISSIYDVFIRHATDMAKYNSLALPILDAFKWFNYKESSKVGDSAIETMSTRKTLDRVYGTSAQRYISQFLQDLNGVRNTDRTTWYGKLFKNAKLAAVAGNLRVVALQPTSYVRAASILKDKYLARALTRKGHPEMAEKYCGIAQWKALGYFDVNIQRSVEEQILGSDAKAKVVEFMTAGAGKADEVTIGKLWNACYYQTKAETNLEGEALYKATGDLLTDVIYRTQVVDSTMTRTELMRGKNFLDAMATAFGSEPILSYNMLMSSFFDASVAKKQKNANKLSKARKQIARSLYAYTITNAVAAVVEGVFDVLRDKDKELTDPEELIKAFWENFKQDMSVVRKIPFIKDIINIFDGYSASRSDMQGFQDAKYLYDNVIKLLNGNGDAAKTLKYSLKTYADFTGIPLYNIYRDSTATLDELYILDADDLADMLNDLF